MIRRQSQPPFFNGTPSLCYDFPLKDRQQMAQLVVPRDMRKAEADRLCAFVMSLATPEKKGVTE